MAQTDEARAQDADVPIEILKPVPPEVYPAGEQEREREPEPAAPPMGPSRLGPAPLDPAWAGGQYGAAYAPGWYGPAWYGAPVPAAYGQHPGYAATLPYPAAPVPGVPAAPRGETAPPRPAPSPRPGGPAPGGQPEPSPRAGADRGQALPPQLAPAGYGAHTAVPAGSAPSTNSLAIVALILVIVGMPLVGGVLGYLALREIERTGEHGRGMAQAALWLGIALTAISVLAVLVSLLVMGVSVLVSVLVGVASLR